LYIGRMQEYQGIRRIIQLHKIEDMGNSKRIGFFEFHNTEQFICGGCYMLKDFITEKFGLKRTKMYTAEPTHEQKIAHLKRIKQSLEKDELYRDFEFKTTHKGEPVLFFRSSPPYDAVAILFIMVINQYGLKRHQINLIFWDDYVEIADVQVLGEENFNKGYGSLLIQEAIKFSAALGYKRIYGRIVSEDENHYRRQKAFYEKNGFTLLENGKEFEMLLSNQAE
jgi:GNAT superfamily N-acetyltransferase